MSPFHRDPPAALLILYGVGVTAAVVFPLWRWFSTGEVTEFLIYPAIALTALVSAIVVPWPHAERVLGVLGGFFFLLFSAFPLNLGYPGNWKLSTFCAWCAVAFFSGLAMVTFRRFCLALALTAALAIGLIRW